MHVLRNLLVGQGWLQSNAERVFDWLFGPFHHNVTIDTYQSTATIDAYQCTATIDGRILGRFRSEDHVID